MVKFYVTRLDSKIKKNILAHAYSRSEMEDIRKALEKQAKERRRGMRIAAGVVAAMLVFMTVSTGQTLGFTSQVFLFTMAVMIAAMVLVFAATWVMCFGIVILQYNRAVRKAYPNEAAELTL